MNKIFAIVAFLWSVAVFSQNQYQGQLLEKAFENKSIEYLHDFFENWHNKILPVSDSDLNEMNNIHLQTYNVFAAFYKPTKIDSLGGSEWGNDIYKPSKYLIVQNSIEIYLTDKVVYNEQEKEQYTIDNVNKIIKNKKKRESFLRREDGKLLASTIYEFGPEGTIARSYEANNELIDSIEDFRPLIKCENKKVLYLTQDYEVLLNAFLGHESIPLGTEGIMNPAKSKNDSEERKLFLENFIKIWYGHWGGYWQLITYPLAYSITFDKNMEYARIDFRVVYEGGEAILKNNEGKWSLISSKKTWIE